MAYTGRIQSTMRRPMPQGSCAKAPRSERRCPCRELDGLSPPWSQKPLARKKLFRKRSPHATFTNNWSTQTRTSPLDRRATELSDGRPPHGLPLCCAGTARARFSISRTQTDVSNSLSNHLAHWFARHTSHRASITTPTTLGPVVNTVDNTVGQCRVKWIIGIKLTEACVQRN